MRIEIVTEPFSIFICRESYGRDDFVRTIFTVRLGKYAYKSGSGFRTVERKWRR